MFSSLQIMISVGINYNNYFWTKIWIDLLRCETNELSDILEIEKVELTRLYLSKPIPGIY